MELSLQELRDRWYTPDGKARLVGIVEALPKGEDWEHFLEGFPGVAEIEDGKDLRGASLQGANLEGVNFHAVNLEGANLYNANLEGANLYEANLKGANLARIRLRCASLRMARLQNAILGEADLGNANLQVANLSGANLHEANLENASLQGANLAGAILPGANLDGTSLRSSILDDTLFVDNKSNDKTDFRFSNLEAARCDSGTRNRLKYSNRRLNWEDRYVKRPFSQWPIRFFWWLSAYGSSVKNLAWFYFVGAFLFAAVYSFYPETIDGLAIGEDGSNRASLITRSIYFSIVTMTTLGFGDLHPASQSVWGHILVSVQVVLSYLLLGAVVARLSVLMQTDKPKSLSDTDSIDAMVDELTEREFNEFKKMKRSILERRSRVRTSSR